MGMEKQFDIIGVCDPVMDMAVSIRHIPATDSLERMNDMLWQSGGNGASAITGAARLGAKCGIIGATGTDAFGDFCYNDMVYHGIDTKYLYRMPGATPFCICLAETETQGRSFIATNTDMGAVQEDQIDEDYVASAKIIHTDLGDFPGKWKAIEYAKKHGVLVSTDAGYYDPSNCDRMIDTADILIMSSMFYKGVFGDDENYVENCRSLLSRGPKIVIVTLGSKGCAGTDGTTDFTLRSPAMRSSTRPARATFSTAPTAMHTCRAGTSCSARDSRAPSPTSIRSVSAAARASRPATWSTRSWRPGRWTCPCSMSARDTIVTSFSSKESDRRRLPNNN